MVNIYVTQNTFQNTCFLKLYDIGANWSELQCLNQSFPSTFPVNSRYKRTKHLFEKKIKRLAKKTSHNEDQDMMVLGKGSILRRGLSTAIDSASLTLVGSLIWQNIVANFPMATSCNSMLIW